MAPTSTQAVKQDQTRIRIVIADDDPDMRELVADCLRGEGYEVKEVTDGAELLARVEDSFFMRRNPEPMDLFVTDIDMPGYTGLEVVSGLRDAGLKTPVVVMTAYSGGEIQKEAEALGAWFLRKPFEAEQLRGVVRQALAQRAA